MGLMSRYVCVAVAIGVAAFGSTRSGAQQAPVPGFPQPPPSAPNEPIQDFGNINYAPLWIPHQPVTYEGDVTLAVSALRVATAEAYLLYGIGRNYHAMADSRYLDNMVKQVDTYFKRRLLHDYYMDLMTASPEERDQRRERALRERIAKPYGTEKVALLVEDMNRLLLELVRLRIQTPGITVGNSAELKPELLQKIWLTDHPAYGRQWRADNPDLTSEVWPRLLQDPRLEAQRTQFQDCLSSAWQQVQQKGSVDLRSADDLWSAKEALEVQFQQVFGESLKAGEGPRHEDYASAKRYLTCLRFQVARLLDNEKGKPIEKLKWSGGRLGDLIDYMGVNGLYFGKPQREGEGTYRNLMSSLARMYQDLAPPPAPAPAPPAAAPKP